MHTGKLVFAQLMEHLPLTTFRRCVARYGGHHKICPPLPVDGFGTKRAGLITAQS